MPDLSNIYPTQMTSSWREDGAYVDLLRRARRSAERPAARLPESCQAVVVIVSMSSDQRR